MNIILKIDSARKLKKYISTHPRIASNTGCEAILDQLYQAYADSQEHDPPEIERDFEQLGELLEILPLDINNTIFSLIFHLCSTYEQKAYCDGLQNGARLMQELFIREAENDYWK